MTDTDHRRPFSIAMLAVLSVLYGVATLYPKVLLLTDKAVYDATFELTEAISDSGVLNVPFRIQILLGFLGSLVAVLAGIFLWLGSNGSRWAIAFWMSAMLALHFLQTGVSLLAIVQVPAYVLVLYLMYRPEVDHFFRPALSGDGFVRELAVGHYRTLQPEPMAASDAWSFEYRKQRICV